MDINKLWSEINNDETKSDIELNTNKFNGDFSSISDNIFSPIKRKFINDLVILYLIILFSIGFVVVYAKNLESTIILVIISLLFTIYTVNYHIRFKNLSKLSIEFNGDIKNVLSNFLNQLKLFIKIERRINAIAIPFSIIFGSLIVPAQKGDNLFQVLLNTKAIVAIFIGIILLYTLTYFFSAWYYKKRYGRYMSDLKNILSDLADD